MTLVPPHGKDRVLKPLLLTGKEKDDALKKAQGLKKLNMTSMEVCDCIMMGIGAFTPLQGFMTKADWQGVCDRMTLADGTFWPMPVTLSATEADAAGISIGEEIALINPEENDEIIAIINVTEKYSIDKKHQCETVFRTTDTNHPGVSKVMAQGEVNIAGPIKVLSESTFPEEFKGIYMTPAESRKIFEDKGWSRIAAFQTRNPMHRSHEYLVKIAIELCDGVFVHQIIGKLKEGDIPADVRTECINTLVEGYFVKDTVVVGGYPMEMRYGGPREALLHGVFRQNFGCSDLIVGRDHAGVGDYYGPFDAQKIYDEIPEGSLELKNMNIDWTFWCNKCDGMASMKTCPHGKDDRVLLSGTLVRKTLSEGGELNPHFSRPEVLTILQKYYAELDNKVEIKLHGAATGESK